MEGSSQSMLFLGLFLLTGVSLTYGQSCNEKVSECSTAMTEGFADIITPQAGVTVCSNLKSTVTTCVSEGKEACSGDSNGITILDNVQAGVTSTCCTFQMTYCQMKVQAGLPTQEGSTFTPEQIQLMCTNLGTAKQCLTDLQGECGSQETYPNVTRFLEESSASCGLVDSINCYPAMACLQTVVSSRLASCSTLVSYSSCVKGLKAQDSCTLKEENVTMDKVHQLAENMCTEMNQFPASYMNCSAVNDCLAQDLGLLSILQSFENGSTPSAALLNTYIEKLTSSDFLCKYLKVAASCYAANKEGCGLTDGFVSKMEDRAKMLTESCKGVTCQDKFTECSTSLAKGLATITSMTPPQDVVGICSNLRSSMTSCVAVGKLLCSNATETVTALDGLLVSLSSTCCSYKVGDCQMKSMAGISPEALQGDTFSPETLQLKCRNQPRAKKCVTDLQAECGNQALYANVTRSFQESDASCKIVNGVNCYPGMMCLQQVVDTPLASCSALVGFTSCVKRLNNDSCTLKGKKVTIDKVHKLAADMCTEMNLFPASYMNCSAVNECMAVDPDLRLQPMLDSLGDGSTPNVALLNTFVGKLTDSDFLCQYLKIAASCYAVNKEGCGLTDDFVSRMEDRAKMLTETCKGDTSGGSALVSYAVLPLLLVAFSGLYF